MFIDMHVHSVSSDDSRATVEQYAHWIEVQRRKGYRIDGMVLTEHRRFDFEKDYSDLAKKHDIVILKGSELDTQYGHFLVYGVTEELTRRFDFASVNLNPIELMREAQRWGAVAMPAHPGRFGVGLYEFLGNGADFSAVRVVEQLNGANRRGEQERAEELIQRYGYWGTGGSDAHLVSALGTCLTEFQNPVRNAEDLMRELSAGQYRAVRLEETRSP